MNKALSIEFYRLFRSRTLYIAFGVGMIFCIWLLVLEQHEWSVIQENIRLYGIEKAGLFYPPSVYNQFIGLDIGHQCSLTLYVLFPLLASLPYAASFFSDKKSGYLKNLLTRERKLHYLIAKFITVFFSGFIVTLSILLFDLVLTMCFFPLLPPEVISAQFTVFIEGQLFRTLFQDSPMLYVLLYIFMDSFFFGLISLVSLAVSVIVRSQFAAIVSGTLIYQGICFILSACRLYGISPNNYLLPAQWISNPYPLSIIVEMAILLLFSIIVFFGAEAKRDVL